MIAKLCAVLFPPLTVRVVGTREDWIVNLAFTLCFYFPGSVHALYVVNREAARKRLAA